MWTLIIIVLIMSVALEMKPVRVYCTLAICVSLALLLTETQWWLLSLRSTVCHQSQLYHSEPTQDFEEYEGNANLTDYVDTRSVIPSKNTSTYGSADKFSLHNATTVNISQAFPQKYVQGSPVPPSEHIQSRTVLEYEYATNDSMTGGRVTGDSVTGDSMNGYSVTGNSMTGDSVTGDSMTYDSMMAENKNSQGFEITYRNLSSYRTATRQNEFNETYPTDRTFSLGSVSGVAYLRERIARINGNSSVVRTNSNFYGEFEANRTFLPHVGVNSTNPTNSAEIESVNSTTSSQYVVNKTYSGEIVEDGGYGINIKVPGVVNSSTDIQLLAWPHKNSFRCGSDSHRVKLNQCQLGQGQTCHLVCDPELYNASDVIITSVFYMKTEFPEYRLPHQKWVVFEVEAPPQTRQAWAKSQVIYTVSTAFNISSFITPDSAVPVSLTRTCVVDQNKLDMLKVSGMNYAKSKTELVAWFVSHCETQSKRESYVKELEKYINVSVYGACGPLRCGGRDNMMPNCARSKLNRMYKFYLSFENSLCQSYVTEKLWKIIFGKHNIIPIVMGGVNYERFLPEKTYINIRDYRSPEHLAQYLWQVSNNDTLYNEYITRKLALKCTKYTEKDQYLCRLCRHAHKFRGIRETVPDILSFWSAQNRCISPNNYLPGDWWQK